MPRCEIKKLDINNMTQYKHEIGERGSIFNYDWQNILRYYEDKNKSRALNDKILKLLALTSIDIKYDQDIHYIKHFGYVFKYDDGVFNNGWNEFVVLGDDVDIAINSMFLYQKYWNAEIGLVTFDKEIFKELEEYLFDINLDKDKILKIIDIIKSLGTLFYYYYYIEKSNIPEKILDFYDNELRQSLVDINKNLEINREYRDNSLPIVTYKKMKHKTKTK